MNTMKLLLGATIALLLGALAVSWQGMKTGVSNAPPDEIARLQKQIKELGAEQEKRKLEKQLQQLRGEADQAPAAANAELEAMKLQLEQNKLALEEIDQKDKDKRDKKVANAEDAFIEGRAVEGKDNELRRARLISQSLLIGKVKEYAEDPQLGGFAIIEVLMPEQVQTGVTIAIRRKTGILGQLKISDVTPEGAIANPLPGFGPVKPEIGDEIILPPQY